MYETPDDKPYGGGGNHPAPSRINMLNINTCFYSVVLDNLSVSKITIIVVLP